MGSAFELRMIVDYEKKGDGFDQPSTQSGGTRLDPSKRWKNLNVFGSFGEKDNVYLEDIFYFHVKRLDKLPL